MNNALFNRIHALTLILFSFFLLLYSSCKEKIDSDCSERIELTSEVVDVIAPVLAKDTLVYEVESSHGLDTFYFIKKDQFTDILKFDNPWTSSSECSIPPDLFLERFHLSYYSNNGDSVVFDIINSSSHRPSLHVHSGRFSMSEGYNSCFFCVPPDTVITLNGKQFKANVLEGTVISTRNSFDMRRSLTSEGRYKLFAEAMERCAAFYNLKLGLLQWTIIDESESPTNYRLIFE